MSLDAAHAAIRERLHQHGALTDEEREMLRSVLWLCSEAMERCGVVEPAHQVRVAADELTGDVGAADAVREMFR